MKKYETEKPTNGVYALYVASWICVFIGALVVVYGIYHMIFNFSNSSLFLLRGFFVIVGLLIMNVCLAFSEKVMAVYKFKPEGLVAIFPIKKEILIPWDDFEEICVCHVWIGNTLETKPIICFARKGEKRNGALRWKTDNPFKCYRVFSIPYTIEYYEGLKERCPYDVPDLRDTLRYKYR